MLWQTGLGCLEGSTVSFKGEIYSLYTDLENNQMSSELDCLTYHGGRFECTNGKLTMVTCQSIGGIPAWRRCEKIHDAILAT